uniref:AAA+ ATPase domain-containing protein n=1 Tax=viral metagenome TaxID=1070528 RepID=A0A6C0DJH3_9ZZZZ
MNVNKEYIPFCEKYRPVEFEGIVLDPLNKQILKNIIKTLYFPNLLFYGPPGTGKTTTIINLIDAYQNRLNNKKKDLIIHLNASDERGIDIIRNQISSFVNSKPLFNNGMKFVILDEVDYMTKNAQQALRYLLQNYSGSVRFCLICNYISRIDEGLQNEFIRLRFNQLPKEQIIHFLKNVSQKEGLYLSEDSLINIQKVFNSDLRSMLNFMQSNQDVIKINNNHPTSKKNTIKKEDNTVFIIENKIWDDLLNRVKKKDKLQDIYDHIHFISKNYNIDKKNLIKAFINYIIRNNRIQINSVFLDFIENIMLSQNHNNNNVLIFYFLTKISSFV